MKEARERIDAIYEALDRQDKELQRRLTKQQASRASRRPATAPENLMEFSNNQSDLMRFSLDPEPQAQQPQTEVRIVRGLPLGRRMPRAEQERLRELQDRQLQEMRARGRVPPEYQLPEVPAQVPDWVQQLDMPDYQSPPPPQWPRDYYQAQGPLTAPWYDQQDFDPYYTHPEDRPLTTSYSEDLAPTWDQPANPRRAPRSRPPREFLEEFDPYYEQEPGHSPRGTTSYFELMSRSAASPSRQRSPRQPRRDQVPTTSSAPSQQASESAAFVTEVEDIIRQTRARLDRAMRRRYGEDLNSALK